LAPELEVGAGKDNRDSRFGSALGDKKENMQFCPGHRDIRNPNHRTNQGTERKKFKGYPRF
jgi:hypothetical protein